MAYSNGTALGLANLHNDLSDFMTTQAGWSLHDTLSSTDKVFRSTGSDGRKNLVMRLNTNAKDKIAAPNDAHNIYDWIFVRGYHAWDNTAHTGINEYSSWGPCILWSSNNISTTRRIRPNMAFDPNYAPTNFPRAVGFSSAYDGRKRIYCLDGTTSGPLCWYDLVNGDKVNIGASAQGNNFGVHPIVVHDKVEDKDFVYSLCNVTLNADQFWRYDTETKAWGKLISGPWGAIGPSTAGALIWDGADTIYGWCGATTSTVFAKYSISANTWTTLAPLPRAPSGSFTTGSKCIYIPASHNGYGEDVILVYLSTVDSKIYKYGVSSNTWSTYIDTGLNSGNADTSRQLTWDQRRYLYVHAPLQSFTTYRIDLLAPIPSLEYVGQLLNDTQNAAQTYLWLNPVVAKIHAHLVDPIEYWFVGNKDRVIVVTKVSGNYYWSYFGHFDSFYKTETMMLEADATAANPATIRVDDTTSYTAGEPIIFTDPISGAVERTTVFAIVSATEFKAAIKNSYKAGTLVGADPSPIIAAADCGMAVANHDGGGFESDFMASAYQLTPIVDSSFSDLTSPTPRNTYMAWPYMIYNSDAALQTNECRGLLVGVYAIKNGAFPAPQAEEEIMIGSSYFKAFPVYETRHNSDKRSVLIGPLE